MIGYEGWWTFPVKMAVILTVFTLAAATPAPPVPEVAAPEIAFRCLSFDDAQIEVAVKDQKDKPVIFQAHSHAFSHEIKVRCKEQTLVIYQAKPAATDLQKATENTGMIPLASAHVPEGTSRFIAVLYRNQSRIALSLIPDPEDPAAAGSMRFFNLCQQQVGIEFPGKSQVLEPGKETVFHPQIAHEAYGQGRLFCLDEGRWRPAGGMRWLQLNDIRSIWFILPTPGQLGTVTLRGIEERIPVGVAPNADLGEIKAPGASRRETSGGRLPAVASRTRTS